MQVEDETSHTNFRHIHSTWYDTLYRSTTHYCTLSFYYGRPVPSALSTTYNVQLLVFVRQTNSCHLRSASCFLHLADGSFPSSRSASKGLEFSLSACQTSDFSIHVETEGTTIPGTKHPTNARNSSDVKIRSCNLQ
jgi:hypothetical protein